MNIEHIKKLDQGKQGITGLCKVDGVVYVYKLSQYMNYLTDHEALILTGVNEIVEYCPHFCKFFKKCKYPIHPQFREKEQDPFEKNDKNIMIDILLMEYIEKSIPLYNLIKNTKIPMSHVMGSIKQVMMAICISQREKHFAHYDLHSLNILMKQCDPNDVHVYVLDDDNVFCVPTYGNRPVIIDYGFSYSDDLNNHPAYISLGYTDAGYMSPGYDPLADPKIFLVSLAEDFKECRSKYKYTKTFRNIIKNIFKPLNIDWKSGWDKTDEIPIIDQLFEYIENANEENSELFKNYPQYCMDILQSLTTLPLQYKIDGTLKELRRSYQIIVYEFSKIETEIHNQFYSLYIFRELVDIARQLRDKYMDETTRQQSVSFFKNEVFESIRKIVKFCTLKTVNFEKLLCSLFVFQEQLECQLYRLLNKTMKNKFKKYMNLDVQRIEHMYGLLDINFIDTYTFNKNSIIHLYDVPNKSHRTLRLEDNQIEQLNNMKQYSWGHFLYESSLDGGHGTYQEEEEVESEEFEEEEVESEEFEENAKNIHHV